ncbi:MAG: hypothetical protein V4819_17110 [Verrucomicrobiota bacterium]
MSAPTLRSPAVQTDWRLASALSQLPEYSKRTVEIAVRMTLVCICLLGVESKAAITFSNPERTISSGNNKGSSQIMEALGNNAFNESVRVDWSESWPSHNTTGQYYSTASQESTISVAGISAKGSVKGTGSFLFWGNQGLSQSSTSYFEIDFSIDTACTVFLTGVIDLYVDLGGTNYDHPEVGVVLSGQNGQIFSQHIYSWSNSQVNQHKQIGETFSSLEAGQYNLTVYAKTIGTYSTYGGGLGGIGGDGYASYDITLIPEPSHYLIAGLGGVLVMMRRVRCSG